MKQHAHVAGSTHGRWTVIRLATPEPRDGCMRARVLCRCVCGHEQMVWLGDIQRGRSVGCRFASCRHRWEATRALRKVLPQQTVEQLVDIAVEREMPVYLLLAEALAEMKAPRSVLRLLIRQDAPQLAEAS